MSMLLPLLALAGLAAATETPGIHELSFFGGTVVSNNLGATSQSETNDGRTRQGADLHAAATRVQVAEVSAA